MKKLIGLVIFIGLIVFLYKTCPEKSEHTEALSEGVTELVSKNVPGVDAELINSMPELQGMIKLFGENMVDVDNYFIFSLGKMKLEEEEQVVSFGIGGYVFTFNDKIVQQGAEWYKKAADFINDKF